MLYDLLQQGERGRSKWAIRMHDCRSDDLMEAMKLLCSADQEHSLCVYSLTPLDGTMQLDIAAISKMLAPGVGDVVSRIFTQPADFQKEFMAVHTWQTVARKQAAAAYEVLTTCCTTV
ncbi:MAG: hypothetical protein HC767_10135 [Akkermansiaceae bacterium]|nr:hypothetical protein [Akkermansiaceae bacterium]